MLRATFSLVLLIIGANARYLITEHVPRWYIDESANILVRDPEDYLFEPSIPVHLKRVSRQAHGSFTMNSDGTSSTALKLPFAGNDRNIFSAISSAGFDNKRHLSSSSLGLAFDNVNGHGASLSQTKIPGFGKQLTAAGHVNLFHNNNHDLTANAFGTRNMPSIPNVPNFNTVGGGLDYMFKNKVGASVGAAHTDFINRNDYSIGGKLNLFRNRDSSLDFNAGLKKFDTPFTRSSWQPNYGFSFSKFF
ncbi:hypothetical protein K1T71_012541 [Dendrolimus kikuchii]|uniref:Uncharacterized protein n=1 Tax=Dendrolimus kikuchii TaxID=765133 RepID=A0ACC1CJQ2_9NEOP|nr:hypothetical protein K1T71_012541 [Dendrolimus kikuchii]